MFLTGHVAAALLASRRWSLNARIAVAAALFPDIVDKPARHLFHLVAFGRIPSHTLLALGLTTAAVSAADRLTGRRGRWAAAWAAGYGTHLALDFADVVPLLWPLRTYQGPHHPLGTARMEITPTLVVTGILELVLTPAAVYVEVRRRRSRRPISSRH